MPRSSVVHEGREYLVNFDDAREPGRIFQSIVMAQLIDELSLRPVSSRLTVSTDLQRVRQKTTSNGIGGLVGVPIRPFPQLDGMPYAFNITFEAEGYTAITRSIDFLAQGTFPDTFDAMDLGQIPTRREPVRISGRVVGLGIAGQTVPINNATVEITGILRLVEDIGGAPAAVPMVSISPELYSPRPAGSTLEVVSLSAVVEPDRLLLRGISAGTRELEVSHSAGLLAGSVIGIDLADSERVEVIEIAAITGPSDPASPAKLDLRFPTKLPHRESALVQLLSVPAPGAADATLAEAAETGDTTLFVDTTAALGPSQTLRISGGPAVPEYTNGRLFSADSDSDGFFRLPPISRVAALEITASRTLPAPALNAVDQFTPNYTLRENNLDMTMS